MAKFGHAYNLRMASDTTVELCREKMVKKEDVELLKQAGSEKLITHGY